MKFELNWPKCLQMSTDVGVIGILLLTTCVIPTPNISTLPSLPILLSTYTKGAKFWTLIFKKKSFLSLYKYLREVD